MAFNGRIHDLISQIILVWKSQEYYTELKCLAMASTPSKDDSLQHHQFDCILNYQTKT